MSESEWDADVNGPSAFLCVIECVEGYFVFYCFFRKKLSIIN